MALTAMAEPVDPRAPTILVKGAAAGDPLIGTDVIGQYRIQKKIGAGGMGTVYLAEQTTVGRAAVIKVLHPASAGDEGMRARFELEANAACQLTAATPKPVPAPVKPPAPEAPPARSRRRTPGIGRRLAGTLRGVAARLVDRLRPKKDPLGTRILAGLGLKARRPWYRRTPWIAVGCLVLLAAFGLAWFALSHGADPAEADLREAPDAGVPSRAGKAGPKRPPRTGATRHETRTPKGR